MIKRFAAAFAFLALPFAAGPESYALADPATPAPTIELPSGAKVYLQEKLEDNLGDFGLTYRFRFVMPDLATRVPSTSGTATDFVDDGEMGHDMGQGADAGAPQDIDTEAMGDEPGGDDYIDDGMIDPQSFDFKPVIVIPGAEEAADAPIIEHIPSEDDPDALPAAPDVLLKDPVHDDIVWICNNIALPEVLKSAKRPEQIIISLADRDSAFGSYDPDVLQIFESFTLPAGKDICEWRPW